MFIKVHSGQQPGHVSGSGFLLQVDGNTALIATNNHVANPTAKNVGAFGAASHEVVFHSGRRNEFTMKAELVASDPERDLAILRVKGVRGADDFPTAINTTDRLSLAETMPVYIFGFPFGEMLSTGQSSPAVTIGKGTISSIREDDAGEAAFIQIDGDVNPGNSGGPVVDTKGRLVGVTVAKLRGTNIGKVIPRLELTRLMNGRLGNLDFRVGRIGEGTVEMEVTGNLIDPLDRVKTPSLRVTRRDALKDKPSVGSDGKWSALPGTEATDLHVSGRLVSGTVKLPLRDQDRGQIEILFQPACEDHDGHTNYFAPVKQMLVITEGPGDAFPGNVRPRPGGGGLPTPPTPPPGPDDKRGPPGGLPAPPPIPPAPPGGRGIPPPKDYPMAPLGPGPKSPIPPPKDYPMAPSGPGGASPVPPPKGPPGKGPPGLSPPPGAPKPPQQPPGTVPGGGPAGLSPPPGGTAPTPPPQGPRPGG